MRLAGNPQALPPVAHQLFASGRAPTGRWASLWHCVCRRRGRGLACSAAYTWTPTSMRAGRRTSCFSWTDSSTPPSRRPGSPAGPLIQDGARVLGRAPPRLRHLSSSIRAGTQPGQAVPLGAPQDESLGQPCGPRCRQTGGHGPVRHKVNPAPPRPPEVLRPAEPARASV